MRPDVRMYVYRATDWGKEPHLVIRIRSLDGMNEEVMITEWDMTLCQDAYEKGQLFAKTIKDLAEMTLLPADDLLRMSAEGENALACRDFMFPRPRIVRKSEPEPEPESAPEPGWAGFLSGVTEAILKAHRDYVFPKARVVKGGDSGR